jgi:molecular chaperone GrpE
MKKHHQAENETEKNIEKTEQQTDNISVPETDAEKKAENISEENNPEQTDETGNNVEFEKLQNQVAEWKDKYARLSAEFDNYRKRTLKEKTELIQSGGEETIKAVLPVVDDFERAIQSMEKSTDIEALKEGTLLIYNKFRDILKQRGVSEIEATSQTFDLDMHEAITKIPAPTPDLAGKVVDVIQKGYTLNGKVIRFSKVVIGE